MVDSTSRDELTGDRSGKPENQFHALNARHPRAIHPGLPTGMGLGKYRILERIRTTHNAIVYKARDAMLDRLVTVKQMTPDLIDDPIACGHFKREAQILARIRRGNSHIIGIHELIEDDLGLFIVEEYVAGDWLEALIAKRRLDLHGAIRILKTAALGLRTLHALGIAHRGIHPRNILVARNGIAKVTNLCTAARESDTTPPPVITPKYAAPEFLIGIEYDDRIDIYALGMLLFEMCVGRPALNRHFAYIVSKPRTADGAWTAWHTNPRARLPLASELNPAIPPELATLIQQMTAKDLDQRLASIQDVLRALSPQKADRFPTPTCSSTGAPPLIHPDSRPAIGLRASASRLLERRALPPAAAVPDGTPQPVPQASTCTVRLADGAPPRTAAPSPSKTAEPSTRTALTPNRRTHSRRRRLGAPHVTTIAPPPPRIRSVPVPTEATETPKTRSPRRLIGLAVAAVIVAAIGIGGWTILARYADGIRGRAIRTAVAEGNAALDRRDLDAAARKLREAARMDVQGLALLAVRDRAEALLILVQAEQALAASDFETAESKLHEAGQRGADQLKIDNLQRRIWSRRDAYRLINEGTAELKRGHFATAELKVDAYENAAAAAGLDPTLLRRELLQSREDRKYASAIESAGVALENGDCDSALAACRDAERIRITAETRQLHKRILDLQKRSEHILCGNDAVLKGDFVRAAQAYEKANRIQTTEKIEAKMRNANARVLYEQALEAITEGDLLIAERRLRNSLWQYKTEQARTKLLKLAPAFEAARLIGKADRALGNGDYDQAIQFYEQALPFLPSPADAAAQKKLLLAREIATSAPDR